MDESWDKLVKAYIPGTRRLHKKLFENVNWYRSWHQSALRVPVHVLVTAATIIGSVIIGAVVTEKSNIQAAAGIAQLFPFQGRLTNPDGTVVADSSYDIVFRLYTVDTAGSAVWTESHTGANNISTVDGIFNVNLGSLTSLGGIDFNQDEYYLGVEVASDGEMTPRIRLGAAPYAFNSDSLDGLSSTDFLILNGQVGGQIAYGGTGSGDDLTLRSTSDATKGDILIGDDGGNIVAGQGALATGATDGFFYHPSTGGVPTGTPTTFTGRVPFVYDTANDNYYAYNAGWQLIGASPDRDRHFFVGKYGSDSNSGKNPDEAFLTIAAAMSAANALSPSASSPVRIDIVDGGVYTENISITNGGIGLIGRAATLVGSLSISGTASPVGVELAYVTPLSGTAVSLTTTGTTFLELGVITTAAGAGTLINQTAGESLITFRDLSPLPGSSESVLVSGGRMQLSGQYINGSTVTGIRVTGGTVDATVQRIKSSTSWDIGASGTLNIVASTIDGSGTETGTVRRYTDKGIKIQGDVLATTNDTYNLGSDSLRWQDLYLGPGTLHIGTSISDEGTITYDTANNELLISSDGVVVIPGGGTDSTRIGSGAASAGSNSVAIGTSSSAGGVNGVAIGNSSSTDALSSNAISIGNSASTSGASGIALGVNATSTLTNSIAIGSGSSSTNQGVAIGSGSSATTGGAAIGLNASITNRGGAIGNGASAADGAAIGLNATSVSTGSAIGSQATSVSTGIALGSVADAQGTDAIAIGNSTVAVTSSIALGRGATTLAANQFAIGSNTTPVINTYLGEGVTSIAPGTTAVLNATGGSGTDISATDLVLAGGRGTGTGAGGDLIFQTASSGTTGTTLNPLTTRLTIDDNGNVVVGTAALSTSATDGFFYTPGNAGAPTGTPTAYTGRYPVTWDSTGDTLYLYDGGWQPIGGAGSGISGSGSAGQATFWTGSMTVGGDNDFWWDNSSKELGIRTTSPNYPLEVNGSIGFTTTGSYRNAITPTYWGYSSAWKALMIGSTSSTYNVDDGAVTISFNYDPSINVNGSFTGDGSEVIFRNGTRFVTPNATDTAWNANNLVLKDGNVGIGVATPSFALGIQGSIGPETNDTYNLGSDSLRWQDIYLGSSTLHIGTSTLDEGTLSYDTATNILEVASLSGINLNLSGTDLVKLVHSGVVNNVTIGDSTDTGSVLIPGSGSSSIGIGNLAIASGANSVSIGNNPDATNTGSIAIGTNTQATGSNSIAIGAVANASTTESIAVGNGATVSSGRGIALGTSSSVTGEGVAIGYQASATTAGDIVFGGDSQILNNLYFGRGKQSGVAATTSTVNATGGLGADNAGFNLALAAGRGTGAAAGGDLLFQTASPSTSGSTLNSLATRLTVDDVGNIIIGTAALGTSATDGFLYFPQTSGAPSGTPTGFTGRVPITWDATGDALYVYEGGSWHTISSGGLTGSGSVGQVTFWNGTSSITGENNLFWNSANDRLGIGTPSPNYPLDITANNTQIRFGDTATDAGGYLISTLDDQGVVTGGVSFNGTNFIAKATDAILFGANVAGSNTGFRVYADSGLTVGAAYSATERFRIDNSGDISVRTGDLRIGDNAGLSSASPTEGVLIFDNVADNSGNTTANKIRLFDNGTNFRAGLGISANDFDLFTGVGGNYRFYSGHVNETTQGTEVFTIDSGGDVGIGVTNPTEDLEVAGALKIGTATSTAEGTIRFTGTDFEGRLGGTWESLTTTTGSFTFGSGTAGQVTYWNGTDTVTGTANFLWNNTQERLSLGTNTSTDTAAIINIPNNQALSARNSANTGNINVITLNSDDEIEFGNTAATDIDLRFDSGGVGARNVRIENGDAGLANLVIEGSLLVHDSNGFATNLASAGSVRLGNADDIAWRNAGNTANFGLTVSSADKWEFDQTSTFITTFVSNNNSATEEQWRFENINVSGLMNVVAEGALIAHSSNAFGGNVATSGGVRLPVGSDVSWRNGVNSADRAINFNSSDKWEYDANAVGGLITTFVSSTNTAAEEQWRFENPTSSLMNVVAEGALVAYGSDGFSSTPASAGLLRLPNNTDVNWRRAGSATNSGISLDSSDRFQFDAVANGGLITTFVSSTNTAAEEQWRFENPTGSLMNIVAEGSLVVHESNSFGATPATAGGVRLPNTSQILWRNAGDTANIGLTLNSSNEFEWTAQSNTISFTSNNTNILDDVWSFENPTSGSANLAIEGSLTVYDSDSFGGSGIVTVSSAGIIPGADDTYDLGSNSFRFRDLYVGPSSLHVVSKAAETTTAREWKISIEETAGSQQGNLQVVLASTDIVNFGTDGTLQIGQGGSGHLSVPGSGTDSQQIGPSATASGLETVALGVSATAAGSNSVAIGHNSNAGASASGSLAIGNDSSVSAGDTIAIGQGASVTTPFTRSNAIGVSALASNYNANALGYDSTASGEAALALGDQTTASALRAIAIGQTANAAFNYSIAIGTGATTTAANQLVVGSVSGQPIDEAYFGSGVTGVTPSSIRFNATGGSGLNNSGASFTIAGGKGTGSAAGGDILFQTAAPGVSGSALNSLTTRLTIDDNGNVYVGTGALATSATNGFLSFPSIPGIPTGTPTITGGRIPITWDSTGNSLYVYEGGWQQVGGGITGSGSSGQVTYWNGSSTVTGESSFTYNSSTDTLTIGTSGSGHISIPGSGSGSERFGAGTNTGTATNATAVGINAAATATNATAVGAAATANAIIGSAFGNNATAGSTAAAFGANSNATFLGSTALGAYADATNTFAIAIGNNADATSTYSISIGGSSNATGDYSVSLGRSANASAAYSIAIGETADSQFSSSIALGRGAATTATNQFVIGSETAEINSVYLGEGVTSSTPLTAVSINASGSSGTDASSTDLILAGGRGTGAGAGGDILFQTAAPGASGSTLNSLTTRLAITDDGFIGVATPSPNTALEVHDNVGTTFTGTGYGNLHLRGTNNAVNSLAEISFGESYAAGGIANAKIAAQFTNAGSVILFGTSNSYGSGVTNTGFAIDETGNLAQGGCTDPDHDLILGGSGTGCDTGTYSEIDAGEASFTISSARALKENFNLVSGANILDKISNVPVYTYDFKDQYCDRAGCKDKIGLIAEDFHTIFERGSDKQINGQEMTMALWLAVQELTKEIGSIEVDQANSELDIDPEFNSVKAQKLAVEQDVTIGGALKVAGSVEFASSLKVESIQVANDLAVEGAILGSKNVRGFDLEVELDEIKVDVEDLELDTVDYAVSITPNWLTDLAVTEKREDGFTVEFSVPAPADAKFDYILIK